MSSARAFAVKIYLVALVLRLIPVLLSRGLGIGLDDMFQYDMLARSLVSGNGYRWYAREDLRQLEPYVKFDVTSVDYDPERGVLTSFRAPLYPAFLAAVYALSGTGFGRFLAARLAQAALLGAPLAPLTYFAARRFFAGGPSEGPSSQEMALERSARRSAWVVAAYPMLVIFPLGLGTENLFFLLVLASAFCPLLASQRRSVVTFLASGFLLGLTALTRSVILPFAGLAVLWTWFDLKEKRGASLIALALALTILPWIARNSLLYGKPTGIETSLGYNLYVGYHPQSSGTFTFGPSLDLVPILDDSLRDRLGTERALDFVRADPGRFIPLAVSRIGHFFRLELRALTYFYSSNFFGYLPTPFLLGIAALFGLPFAVLGLSAALGAPLLEWNPRARLLALLFISYLLPHVLILSEERFHLALIPFMAMLAARCWTLGPPVLMTRFHGSRAGRTAVSIAIAACALLMLNWAHQFGTEAGKYAALLGPGGNHTYFPY